ncbi:MAG: hypothetical protein C4344_00710 [Acidimicrobiia bacterium]
MWRAPTPVGSAKPTDSRQLGPDEACSTDTCDAGHDRHTVTIPGVYGSHVAYFLPDLPLSGVERVTLRLADAVAQAGAVVDLVVASNRGDLATRIPASVARVDLGCQRVATSIPRLIRYLREARPHVLVAAKDHAIGAALIATAFSGRRIPVVAMFHGLPECTSTKGASWVGRHILPRVLRHLLPRAAEVVAVSEGVRGSVADAFRLPLEKIIVAPMPALSDDNLSEKETSAAVDVDPRSRGLLPPVVLTVARLAPEENLDVLLEAFGLVRSRRNAQLVIVGDGPLRKHLTAKAEILAIANDVSFVGSVDDVRPYLDAATLFVLTSGHEGLPLALLEALDAGLPVIATDTTGPREILSADLGTLVAVDDVTGLVDAIVAGIDQPVSPPPESAAKVLAPYRHQNASSRHIELVSRYTCQQAHRTPPTVTLAVVCHQRPDELEVALASAAEDGWDEIAVLDMASAPPLARRPAVRWSRFDTNVGCAAGRNHLVSRTSSDVVFFLDDDAVLPQPVAARIRAQFALRPRLGALAVRIVRTDGTTASHEYPFRGRARGGDHQRACAYFVGCAAALRREAFEEVGGFDERYFYSTEELDLSLALSRRGWELWYDPGVVVEHRPSARGRATDADVVGWRIRNRVLLVRRHMPLPFAAVHLVAWTLRTGLEAIRAGDLRPWVRGIRDGVRLPVRREPLPLLAAWRVHRLGGRTIW